MKIPDIEDVVNKHSKLLNIEDHIFEKGNLKNFNDWMLNQAVSVNEKYNIPHKTIIVIMNIIVTVFGIALGAIIDDLYHEKKFFELYLIVSIYSVSLLSLAMLQCFVPSDLKLLKSEINQIKFLSLIKFLAAEISLYYDDSNNFNKIDLKSIEKFSQYIPDLESINHEDVQKIKRIKEDRLYDNSRETNISLNIANENILPITEYCQSVYKLCQEVYPYMHDVKLYLLTENEICSRKIRILTSFGKFPSKHAATYLTQYSTFGSSWVEAKGNPSLVWKVFESNSSRVKSFDGLNYKSAYAIPLPGKTGVLAITSSVENAFECQDKYFENALAVSALNCAKKYLVE